MAKKKGEKDEGTSTALAMAGNAEIGLAETMPAELAERLAGGGGEALKKNMDHQSDSRCLFARIDIGHGAEVFKMPPDESGEQQKVTELVGIVLDAHPYNAYWNKANDPEDGSSRPPDCFSPDGLAPTSTEPQSPKCASCKLNKFGSDPEGGKGKACGNRRMVHLMMEGSPFPFRVQVTPSSFRPWDEYMAMLSRKGIPRDLVHTRMRLKPRKEGQYEWSELTFDIVGYVPSNEAYDGLLKFREEWIEQMREVKLEDVTEKTTEATTETDTTSGYDPSTGGEVIDAQAGDKAPISEDDVPF